MIDNVPQAKWLETAPPDDEIIARFTKLGEWPMHIDHGPPVMIHLYFDTRTDMLYRCADFGEYTKWLVTDPNRKGIFGDEAPKLPRAKMYGLVGENGSHTVHAVRGQSTTTVCGKTIGPMWPRARGLETRAQFTNSPVSCIKCGEGME